MFASRSCNIYGSERSVGQPVVKLCSRLLHKSALVRIKTHLDGSIIKSAPAASPSASVKRGIQAQEGAKEKDKLDCTCTFYLFLLLLPVVRGVID